jgi:hypothetical protein
MHNCPHVFVRNKYTTFSSVGIVALWSVNKIFPKNYDFAVTQGLILHIEFLVKAMKVVINVHVSEVHWQYGH